MLPKLAFELTVANCGIFGSDCQEVGLGFGSLGGVADVQREPSLPFIHTCAKTSNC